MSSLVSSGFFKHSILPSGDCIHNIVTNRAELSIFNRSAVTYNVSYTGPDGPVLTIVYIKFTKDGMPL